jgi:hypothetical protein
LYLRFHGCKSEFNLAQRQLYYLSDRSSHCT